MVLWLLSLAWPTDWVRLVFLAAYLTIAIAVTVHALLKQSKVRTALGWIGVAWFSPYLGGVIYYVFGINRVARRAVKLDKLGTRHSLSTEAALQPKSPNIGMLANIGSQITGRAVVAGNRFTILRGGSTAYPTMLSAIAQAQHCIAMASYIFRDDEIGNAFVDALIAARNRGVVVRVLLDGMGAGYFRPAILRRLRAAGVTAERFLHTWVPWRMPFLNIRNHKKLLIVDGKRGFTGGLNIGAEYFESKISSTSIADVHAELDGPIVRQLMEDFAQDWSFTTNEILDESIWWPRIESVGAAFARGISSGPDAEINKLETLLGAALAQARKRVRIVTPYFLPDESLQVAITQARLRGAAVDIVIPEKCDIALLDWAMRAHLRFFLGDRTGIHASPPPFDHAKLMTVDGEWSLIGSSNWDARSLRLNFEFDVECYDGSVTAAIDALIDERIARSRTLNLVTLMAVPKRVQLRDAAARLLLPYL